MPAYRVGRHELGQNFLTERTTIDSIVELVSRTDGPIVEIGSGGGALTLPLQRLRRPITAIEIDSSYALKLRRRVSSNTTVVNTDFLRYRLPQTPCTVVGNLPFHHTTAILRRVLHADYWTAAVLIVQWEVARRRAAVGGATMMTAQWWPWYEFGLAGRVPASAFTPRPGVDAGIMTIARRRTPLVDPALRPVYSRFVHAVFTGKGHGLHQILPRVAGRSGRTAVKKWLADQQFRGTPLPRDLSAKQWSELFAVTGQSAWFTEQIQGGRPQ
ncbi:23S ribosomal RNA methyltransferase Erm [Kocuria sp. p3-SID1433]|uniref:23S rRNA (adenine(2058)-N(6))-methyltransferase Erm(46) n=1 Tax=unclassified Kocuria TaxID=2649579 RepID=UPI0021A275B1|nr:MULTISPECIES: 23S rRNA (adenine(2058)-N(6))-methyltransferase Erm(46) [unclassified Kocuria]MCT1602939.1 23S ribosomal RNA methyltransferase Erm [Kocuria sp. p3-SID1428]MCT2180968.1 23S ribosomal RNA methyltransferase Erm [Kocuria sp. p3-SID1433]